VESGGNGTEMESSGDRTKAVVMEQKQHGMGGKQ
jgi:hypothetical protein